MEIQIDPNKLDGLDVRRFLKKNGEPAVLPKWGDLQWQCGKNYLPVLLAKDQRAIILYSQEEFGSHENEITNKNLFVVSKAELLKVSTNLQDRLKETAGQMTYNGKTPANQPRIAIVGPDLDADATKRKYWLQFYGQAVARLGLAHEYLSPEKARNGVNYEKYSGFIVMGGDDVRPERYGAEPHPKTGPANDARDEFESELIPELVKRGIPSLLICRGMQITNTVFKGTLTQHLPDEFGLHKDNPDVVVHNYKNEKPWDREKLKVDPLKAPFDRNLNLTVPEREYAPGHEVEVTKTDSLLSKITRGITGNKPFKTTALHHQAVNKPGNGLDVVARTKDGVAEAIELSPNLIRELTHGKEHSHPFFLCIQWHPEELARKGDKVAQAILNAFGTATVSRGQVLRNHEPVETPAQQRLAKLNQQPGLVTNSPRIGR
jgi:putative glutamine amidotransferase